MRIRSPRDFWAGLFFMAVAAAFISVAWGYRFGTSQRMGPAYFPTVVASILAVLGFLITVRSLFLKGAPVDAIGFRQLAITLLAVVAFGVMLSNFGLVAAILTLVFVGAFADPESRVIETIVLGVFLAVFSVGVFVYLLGLPLPVWPDGLLAYIGRG